MADASKYGVWEIALSGPKDGNPFAEQWVKLKVSSLNEEKEADGFYDGDGRYVARFMPSFEGRYTYTIHGNTICMKIKDIEAEEECYDYDEDTRTLKNEQGAVYYRQIEE